MIQSRGILQGDQAKESRSFRRQWNPSTPVFNDETSAKSSRLERRLSITDAASFEGNCVSWNHKIPGKTLNAVPFMTPRDPVFVNFVPFVAKNLPSLIPPWDQGVLIFQYRALDSGRKPGSGELVRGLAAEVECAAGVVGSEGGGKLVSLVNGADQISLC